MKRLISPLCLLLALAMLIMAITLLAVGAPEASVELHAARAQGDETFLDVWEADLVRRQRWHFGLVAALLMGSAGMTWNAFRCMR